MPIVSWLFTFWSIDSFVPIPSADRTNFFSKNVLESAIYATLPIISKEENSPKTLAIANTIILTKATSEKY